MKQQDPQQVYTRQVKRYFALLDRGIAALHGVPLGQAIHVLGSYTGELRILVNKIRHVFTQGTALSLTTKELLARICKHVFTKEDLKIHYPEVRDWLYDNGYDQSGQRNSTVLDAVERKEETGRSGL